MRKSLIGVLAIALLVIGEPSYAAVANGAACKVRNQTAKSKGVTYKCTVVGKRLTWRKVPASQSNSATKPSAAPTPTSALPPKPTFPQSIDRLDPYWTKFVVYEHLDAYGSALTSDFKPSISFSPSVDAAMQTLQSRLLERSIRFWSPIFTPESRYGQPAFQILYFDNDDVAWAKGRAQETRNQPNYGFDSAKSGVYCDFGNAGNFNSIVMCIPESASFKFQSRQTGPHEYTHAMQYWMVGDWKDATLDNPCWLQEGAATYYGIYLGSEGQDPTHIEQRAFLKQLANSFNMQNGLSGSSTMQAVLAANDPAKTAALIRETSESVGVRNPMKNAHICYSLGSLMTEAFLAAYGQEAMIRYYEGFKTSREWSLNFKNATGVTPGEFYTKVTPYLAEVAKRDL